VAERLIEPLLLTDDWPEPTPPFPVGTGAVHADLTDDDHELFASLRRSLAAGEGALDAEELASLAQELRLPVTPYRTGPDRTGRSRPGPAPTPPPLPSERPVRAPAHRRPLVVDLTALWAGPLATALLAAVGAEVVKIDPDCRPDGLRLHPPVYEALNGAKTIIDLDLRSDSDRRRFEHLLARADLVIDSFSRRVMPNFGYGPETLHRHYPQLATLSIVAFPAGSPERDWVSYGPGVHAISGLAASPSPTGQETAGTGGDEGLRHLRAAPIAYPDALAGLAAFAAAAELLTGTSCLPHREVSLLGSLRPLLDGAVDAHAGAGPTSEPVAEGSDPEIDSQGTAGGSS
jgi:hypothetical protein